MTTTSATTLRSAVYRKPRVIRTVTLETGSWAPFVILVRKGTGRTCWAGSAETLPEAVAEFRRAIESVESQGLTVSSDTVLADHRDAAVEEAHELALAANFRS